MNCCRRCRFTPVRKWWNWQTHHLEGVAPKGVGVQIPPSAPQVLLAWQRSAEHKKYSALQVTRDAVKENQTHADWIHYRRTHSGLFLHHCGRTVTERQERRHFCRV